jgi:hypothetical protein
LVPGVRPEQTVLSDATTIFGDVLNSDEKGFIAETALAHAAARLGIGVLRPMNGSVRYDLVFDVSGKLVRVQCKWAMEQGDVILVRCYSSRRGPNRMLRRCYTPDEVDAIAAYCHSLDRCYFLPFSFVDGRTQVSLRLGPTRNGQERGVRWAADFDFTRLDWDSLVGP